MHIVQFLCIFYATTTHIITHITTHHHTPHHPPPTPQDADKTTLESVAVTTQQTNDPLDAYLLDILPDIAAAQQQPNILTLPDQHSRDSEDEEEEEEGW